MFHERFPSAREAVDFIENTIEFFLVERAAHVVVADERARTERKYRAEEIADCISVECDWFESLQS